MNDVELIDYFGGTNAVARFFKVKQPSVSGWKKKGMPNYRREVLEKAIDHPEVIGICPVRSSNKKKAA